MSASSRQKSSQASPRSLLWKLWISAWVIAGGYLLASVALDPEPEATSPVVGPAREILEVTAATFARSNERSFDEAACTSADAPRTKNIEDVIVGDVVLSMDDNTGELACKRVVALFRNTSYHLRLVRFRSESGIEQEVNTTDEHPFFVTERGWIEAQHLELGDAILDANKQVSYVTHSRREEHPDGVDVFNFEVEDYHTYFVAQDCELPLLLVHNRCHANSRRSRIPNQGYTIYKNGSIFKFGISSGGTNSQGKSIRAATQVRRLNRSATNGDVYTTSKNLKQFKTRKQALDWEQAKVDAYYNRLNRMPPGMNRPTPSSP
jgi:hypothetical protein